MSEDIKTALRDFITKELRPGANVGDDESLLENGILDSMAITRLIEHIEDRFEVSVSDEDLDPEQFETINAIVAMVQRLKSS